MCVRNSSSVCVPASSDERGDARIGNEAARTRAGCSGDEASSSTSYYSPFVITIERGILTKVVDSQNTPPEFIELIELIRQVEGDCYVRELGIGINPHVGIGKTLSDVTAFERQAGIHLSLGKRHPLFPKKNVRGAKQVGPVVRRKDGRFHIDIFLNAKRLKVYKAMTAADCGDEGVCEQRLAHTVEY